ncbi:gamma-glutamyl-gamma-aminobutyrate hydrolase family protein [Lacrimispora indolis]|uniref:gamma-glutamyl-gamma-aminobutyrate hydrolase family protein n=1 Tax=Lacrimispora indolis TaxID=69825 RepID=UPI00045E7242|nr:gamma-glutamyl-gamma-aminobutyrate hydrolase family protein [Lacrimispora indolis]
MKKEDKDWKPVILITGEEGFDPSFGTANFIMNRKYTGYAAKNGGLPFMPEDIRMAKEYVELSDGLILSHGPDIHRGRYGQYYTDFKEMRDICSTRDDFEFTLFTLFAEAGKPVLGIGRGMQVINTALGGTLYLPDSKKKKELDQDLSGELKFVYPEPKSRLFALSGSSFPAELFKIPGISKLGINMRPTAFSEKECIEALEHDDLPILGIGWNPLNENTGAQNHSLFHYFIQICKGAE